MPEINTSQDPLITSEYRITVTRVDHNFKTRDKEYEKLGSKKTNDRGQEEDAYGYVYFDSFVDKSTEVYNQTVTKINLTSVIKAVNYMEEA